MYYYTFLLRMFGSLNGKIEMLDKVIVHRAVVTHNCYRDSLMRTTSEQIGDIAELIAVRSAVQYLRQSIVKAMNSLSKNDRLLLILLYVRNVDKEKICKYFGFSLRTLYRRAKSAGNSFMLAMERLGIDKQWINDNVRAVLEGKAYIR